MTLRMEIFEANFKEPLLTGLIAIEVRGSKSGPLISNQVIAEDTVWRPPFLVQCHHHDSLQIKVLSIQEENIVCIGSSKFQSRNFIEIYEQNLSSESIKQQISLQKDGQLVGKLTAQISYDSTLIYEGQMPGKINLNISSKQQVLPFPIYNGKNQTINAFSFLDESVSAQRCKFNESIYRDGK